MTGSGIHLDRRRMLASVGMMMLAGPSLVERVLARQAIAKEREPLFRISLAQWSLHRTLRAGDLDHLDFPRCSREDFGIEAVEYVNTFFARGADDAYIAELRKRCDDIGVRSLLIMCDSEGALGDPDEEKRSKAVSNHHKWVEAAAALGCHSIRVNAQSRGDFEEQQKLAADGLRRLCEFADPHKINVIVENHWGLSSNAAWLVGVMELVDHPRCGTLPDFGNFDPKVYDRYRGVQEMMAWSKGVSAKSKDFDEISGEETEIDYRRMLKIVLLSGYRDFIGIEYEGRRLSERDGILATKLLLERLREEFSRDEEMR